MGGLSETGLSSKVRKELHAEEQRRGRIVSGNLNKAQRGGGREPGMQQRHKQNPNTKLAQGCSLTFSSRGLMLINGLLHLFLVAVLLQGWRSISCTLSGKMCTGLSLFMELAKPAAFTWGGASVLSSWHVQQFWQSKGSGVFCTSLHKELWPPLPECLLWIQRGC